MKSIDLSGAWKLRPEFLDTHIQDYALVLARPEGELRFFERSRNRKPTNFGWMDAQVPCDVIQPLVQYGLLKEPFEKLGTVDSLWIKDLSWWFVKRFTASADLLSEEKVFLRFETLDFKADFVLNGAVLGRHANTFAPFEMEVKRFLKQGENTLVIRLTSGVEDFYNHTSVSHFAGSPFAIQDNRMYLRKPQFTYGWDWCKPVPTCGIGRGATLTGISGAQISYLHVHTISAGPRLARLGIRVEIDQLWEHASDDIEIEIELSKDGREVAHITKAARVVGGLSYHNFEVEVENPALWMPNGYGGQPLYDVRACVRCRGSENAHKPLRIGIRKIKLDESRLEDGTYLFAFVVNGVRIYAKGGNWVPADSVYLRLPDSTYRTLVEEAAEQHFTMLRMWGGGLYEPEVFYQACDELGILIMHDFMYACSYYPEHEDWFLHEAKKEAEYQTRRLANHPCMAIWMGNNEIHESYTDWFPEEENLPYLPGGKIFNYIQPRAVQDNCPEIPYKPSSPYGGSRSNSQEEGDSHVWRWMGMLSKAHPGKVHVLETFDQLTTRFSSEYGFHGPMMKSSMLRCLGDDPEGWSFKSPNWIHHGEQPSKTQRIKQSISQYFVDAEALNEDGYLLYGGVTHGMLYREMGDALRKKDYCYGHLIWMYNDCWPETGWTTVDYYLTRKIAFYFLKRAFAPKKLLLTREGDTVQVIVHNETPDPISVKVLYGNASFGAQSLDGQETVLTAPPHTRHEALRFPAGEDFGFVLPLKDDQIDPATTVRGNYRAYPLKTPQLSLAAQEEGGSTFATITSDVYVPVAYLEFEDDRTRLSDNYFELLPGASKTVCIKGRCAKTVTVKALEIQPL